MEMKGIELTNQFITAVQDASPVKISRGSALMIITELKLTDDNKLPLMLAQLQLKSPTGDPLPYEDTFEAVAAALKVVEDFYTKSSSSPIANGEDADDSYF